MGKADKPEQIHIEGTERPTDQQLENAIRAIKGKTEARTEAGNELKKAKDKGQSLLEEKELPEYISEKQGFKLVKRNRDDVKLEHWTPPRPPKVTENGAEE